MSKYMSKYMVQRILVLVIILLLTTFLFFIIHGNRKSHEGMENQFVTINGIKITKDTPSKDLQDLLQKERKEKENNEQKIKDCRKNIIENNKARGDLVKLVGTYKDEIEKNKKNIDADTIAIETADVNNQIFTAENELLEKDIDVLFDRISDLKDEREIIDQSNPITRKEIRDKNRKIQVNQNNKNRAKNKIDNKTAKIFYNDDQIVDVTTFQTRIKTLLTREIELEKLLKSSREKWVVYANLNQELRGQITFYQSKIEELKKNIMYLEAALQDLTSRTANPNNASGMVASSNSGA